MTDTEDTEIISGATQILEALPFVAQNGNDLAYWQINPTGDENTDIDTGERYARLAIEAARRFQNPLILALIIRDMVAGGHVGPMEAGFLFVVANSARVGSLN